MVKLSPESVAEGMWVKVIYKKELFLGKLVAVCDRGCDYCCFKMPYRTEYNGTTFESKDDSVFFHTVYAVNNNPVNVKVGRQFLWQYEMDR